MRLRFKEKDFEYNSHDFGEMGKFIRIEYAANVANRILEAHESKLVMVYRRNFSTQWIEFRRKLIDRKKLPTEAKGRKQIYNSSALLYNVEKID